MSEIYDPNPGILPEDPTYTALLSHRDLGSRVPINFMTEPGVSLTSVCFARQVYEDDAMADCVSNLLALGFKRFEIDLYWDQNRKFWSFCPVEILQSAVSSSGIPSTSTTDASSGLGTFTPGIQSTGSLNQSQTQSHISARQLDTTSLSGSSTTISSSTKVSLQEIAATVSSTPDTPDLATVKVGPFACTASIGIASFASLLFDYIEKTQNTLDARLIYAFFNIHAVSTANSPTQPAPKPSTLPASSELIGTILSTNLSAYIYTPEELITDRLDLNRSWYFEVEKLYEPLEGFYQTEADENDVISTSDGWPSEGYLEFSQGKRLLLGWGSTDVQMQEYNFRGDAATIFQSGYLASPQSEVRASSDGEVTKGCFFGSGTAELSQLNSSWAISYSVPNFTYPTLASEDLNSLLTLVQNLTNCGISPHLNHTLLAATANQNYTPYLDFSEAILWTWAPHQPWNDTTSAAAPNYNAKALYRCATTSPLTGRWSVSDCYTKYPAACRSPSQPYNWTLTNVLNPYASASKGCPNGYEFSAPRTALENAYLTQRLRDAGNARTGNVWVDFNDVDAESCWVTGGETAKCPYSNDQDINEMRKRYILVPTIAAVIVLVITILTFFIKCAGARNTRKRGKRRMWKAHNGFVYEGVPS